MHNKTSLAKVSGIVALVAAIFLIGIKLNWFTTPQVSSPEKIGVLLPMTGPAASTGDQLRKAISLALEDHVARGGGKAEMILEDSKNEPAAGIAGFRKLANLDKVKFTIVSLSAVSQAVAPVANSEKAPAFALASAPISTAANDYMLRWFIDGAGEARMIANYLLSKGMKRISVIHINDDYGRVLLEEFKAQLKANGLVPVSVEGFDRKNEDFRPLAFHAKEANPDAIYFIAYGRPLGIALRQSKEAGLAMPFFSTFGFEIAGTRELAGSAAEDLIYTSIAFGEGVKETDATRKFVAHFREKYNMEPSSDAALAYDLTTTLLSTNAPINVPRQAVGTTFLTQFGSLQLSDKLEVLAPVVLKRIQGGHVSQLQP